MSKVRLCLRKANLSRGNQQRQHQEECLHNFSLRRVGQTDNPIRRRAAMMNPKRLANFGFGLAIAPAGNVWVVCCGVVGVIISVSGIKEKCIAVAHGKIEEGICRKSLASD